MYLNLFFKSVKADENNERVKALIRRFTQVLVTGGGGAPEFVAGGLYLLGEVCVSSALSVFCFDYRLIIYLLITVVEQHSRIESVAESTTTERSDGSWYAV